MTTTTVAGASTSGAPAQGRRRQRGGPLGDGWWPWLFIVPLLAGVSLFYLWPIVQTVYFSFTKWTAFGRSQKWVGTDNYTDLFSDPILVRALGNTLLYTAIVLLGVPIAVFIASLINRPGLRFAKLYRVAFFMPYVAMPTAIALVWRMIYNGDFGVLNYALSLIGVSGPHWTSEPGFAIISVGILGLWASLGFSMIILSAGLKNIPPELYEAARVDGASNWRQFRSITVPLLTPSIFFVVIITIINGFQLFDLLFALLGQGNPALPESQSLVYLFYKMGFVDNQKGYAAAIAIVILAIIGAVTALQFRLQKRWVNYV